MIFEKLYARETLEAAWRHVRSKRARAGVDRVEPVDFEKNIEKNLDALQEEIRSETYRPGPVMAYEIRRGGNPRNIGISTVRDRVAQQAAVSVLSPVFEPHFLPCSFAYRAKKSATRAAAAAADHIAKGRHWVLQTDVSRFFDSIDHDILMGILETSVPEKPVLRLIRRMLKAKIFREMGLFDTTIGSHQGSGLSPLLSNVYMQSVDRAMWKRFSSGYLRYSDDIALFCGERETLDEGLRLAKELLSELGLSVNPEKTLMTHASAGVVYLGFYMDVNGKGPSLKSIEQLHKKLEAIPPVRKTDVVSERMAAVEAQVRGWHNYYHSVKAVTPQNILSLLALVRLARDAGEVKYARNLIRQHEIFPHNHPDLAVAIGDTFQELGMRNQAAREYARALELDPSSGVARERIRKMGQTEAEDHKAVEYWKTVLHRAPDFREGYERLAELYVRMGLFGFAEEAARKAMEMEAPPEGPAGDAERIASFSRSNCPDSETAEIDPEYFLALFAGRRDAHARQWVDAKGRSGFVRVARPMEAADVREHFSGRETLAVYPVTERGTVGFVVFDVDVAKRRILEGDREEFESLVQQTHRDMLRIKSVCASFGLELYIEDSGYKGRHGWLFFSAETPADRAIALGKAILRRAGKPSSDILWELFPHGKIDRDQCLIKLPLGVHKKNNRRSHFLKDDGSPLADFPGRGNDARKNDFPASRVGSGKNEGEIVFDDKGKIEGPAGLTTMINGCGVVNHLIRKSVETQYLNHYERICLLYTLTFAGEPGHRFLHKVVGFCLNYSHHHTQRYVDSRKESPISCARIGENFPDLAERFCHCRLKPPPRGYPSPVLYLLTAEIQATSLPKSFSRENPVRIGETANPEEKTAASAPNEPEHSRKSTLDFQHIFMAEREEDAEREPISGEPERPEKQTAVETDEKEAPPVESVAKSTNFEANFSGEAKAENGVSPTNFERSERGEGGADQGAGKNEGWNLFLKYLRLRHRRDEIVREIHEAEEALNKIFDGLDENFLQADYGTIRRRRRPDGRSEWELRCE